MACLSIIFHTLVKVKMVTKLSVNRPFLGLNPFLCLGFESHQFFLVESNLVSWEIFELMLSWEKSAINGGFSMIRFDVDVHFGCSMWLQYVNGIEKIP